MTSPAIDPRNGIAELEAEIEHLKARRNKLEQRLDAPGVSEAMYIAILRSMDQTTDNICRAEQEVFKLWRPAPPPYNPTFRELCDASLAHYVATLSDPLVLEFTVISATVCMWFIMRNYMFMRLRRGAYTQEQVNFRNTVFGLHFSRVPGAVRLGAGAALVAVIRSWSLTLQPKESH